FLISATRQGYFGARFAQSRGNGLAGAVKVDANAVFFAEVRMERLGAISGTIFDENRLGIPDHQVMVYKQDVPLRMMGLAKTDDRGFYRVGNLSPGRYLVRTGPRELEDGSGLLPTFFPDAAGPADAKPIDLDLEREVAEIDIQPLPGRLNHLSGTVSGCQPPAWVKLTLSSDGGRKESTASCGGAYRFDELSPGSYELLAELQSGGAPLASHREIYIDRDSEGVGLQVAPMPVVTFQTESRDGIALRANTLLITARRKDLAGESRSMQIGTENGLFTPGYWEVAVLPPSSHYVASIAATPARGRSRAGANADWKEIYFGAGNTRVKVVVSQRPAHLIGKVTASGAPVASIPVYLQGRDVDLRRRLNGPRMARTDNQGTYRFDGLPPGSYLVTSSPEMGDVTLESMLAARASPVTIAEGTEATQDLDLASANQ
ncbi:MAG: carboxypeptidase-like regulatory domain-containing protein, partial [Bryobacteraceae bacterium]